MCGRLNATTTKETDLTENYTPTLATLILAVAVALLAAGSASYKVRLSGGGTSAAARYVPGTIYFRSVAPEIKRRRALLDVTTIAATVVTSVWFAWAFIPAAFVWASLAVACATDIRVYRLPHRLTRLNGIAAVAFAALATLSLVDTLLAAASGLLFGLLFFGIGVASNGQLGMGDVYLALGTGVFVGAAWGLWAVPIAFVATTLVSAVYLIALLVIKRGRLNRKQKLPFGPHIAIGSVLALIFGMWASLSVDPAWGLLSSVVRL